MLVCGKCVLVIMGNPDLSRVSASVGMHGLMKTKQGACFCVSGMTPRPREGARGGELCVYLPKILPSTRDLTALNSVPEDRLTWLWASWSTCPMRSKHQHICQLSVTWQEARGGHGVETIHKKRNVGLHLMENPTLRSSPSTVEH